MQNDWIDISVPLRNGMVAWPGDPPFERHLAEQIAKGDAANVSAISGSVHSGTHMDAPRHFIEGAASISEIPLSVCAGKARVISIQNQVAIPISELEPHNIRAGERILFRTANSGRVWRTDRFEENFVYIPPDTAEYLAARKALLVGVDYLSVGGFKSGGPETHRALLGGGVWIVEGLNLENVDPGDYDLICLPVKIAGSDGAPSRAILRRI